jgi:hypothetical protein
MQNVAQPIHMARVVLSGEFEGGPLNFRPPQSLHGVNDHRIRDIPARLDRIDEERDELVAQLRMRHDPLNGLIERAVIEVASILVAVMELADGRTQTPEFFDRICHESSSSSSALRIVPNPAKNFLAWFKLG